MTTTAIEYIIGDLPIIEVFNSAYVTSSETIVACPPISFSIIDQDTQLPPDADVFTTDI